MGCGLVVPRQRRAWQQPQRTTVQRLGCAVLHLPPAAPAGAAHAPPSPEPPSPSPSPCPPRTQKTDAELGRLLGQLQAAAAELDPVAAAVVRDSAKDYVRATALPKELAQRVAQLESSAYAVRGRAGVGVGVRRGRGWGRGGGRQPGAAAAGGS
jgi:hypothetical protein